MNLRLLAALIFGLAVPCSADVTYTITLTDEQNETMVEQAKIVNDAGGPIRARGAAHIPITPEQFLERTTRAMVDRWEDGQHEKAARKSNAERTPREKRLICRKLDLNPCPK